MPRPVPPPPLAPADPPRWTFLTNHAHVLVFLARHPDARLRDVAAAVGVTERAAQRIVRDLEAEGYLERERAGRRNRYRVDPLRPLRHPMDRATCVKDVLRALQAIS